MPLLLGGIVSWSGSINQIPQGWALCDGQNETPDLRNRFVVGAGDTYTVNATGGSPDAILVSHTHTGTTNTIGNHSHSFFNTTGSGGAYVRIRMIGESTYSDANINTSGAGSHTHTVTVDTVGDSAINANLPPYYALAFIKQFE